ncbi:LamG-like jellyroll fold domain-containing protein [Nonomuraea sp. B19D2]|uniref:LamG-like jellyroll fold domain-containing protein n=1 Tax=Nonomuraea sp. B19D2 TaxID=3159561 RepID=UPI0032D9D1B5
MTTFPRPEDPDASLRAAIEEAKKQNKAVAVQAAFTETSRTWAYPDGHLSTQSYNGPAQLRQADGSWAWIDSTLEEKNGVLKPRLAKGGLQVSAGGPGPFASMRLGREGTFALSWPTALPKPQVKGNVATYVGAAGPSADLVVTALPTGFRHDVVLRERPTGPVEYRIPVQAPGLTLRETKSGMLTLSGAKGKKVATVPAPRMWDAAAAKADAQRPGREAKVATEVKREDGGTVLVLKPDPKWLADPATQYPVTVDPTTTLGVTQEVSVKSPVYQKGPGLVSRSNYKNCPTTATCTYPNEQATRALLAFDTAPITGRQVVKATMQLSLNGNATTCGTLQAVSAFRITEPWVADDTFWGNQPAATAEGRSSLDPCAQVRTDGAIWSWDLTAITSAWASGTANHGVQLRLGDELPVPKDFGEDYSFWAQLWGGARVPKLSVDWVLPPEIPTVTAESIDSMTGNDAIARSTNVKVTYKSSVPETANLDYTVTVNDSTMAPPAAQLPMGEAALWKLDETSGTSAADSSGNGFNSTLTGTYSRVPGQLGQAVKLSPGGLASTGKPVLNTDQSYTVTAWVRLDSTSTDQAVLSQMGTNTPAFSLGYLTSDAAELDQRWTLTLMDVDSATTIRPVPIQPKTLAKPGQWQHLAAQYDASAHKMRLYVDGELAAERDHTVTWNAGGAFEIGRGKIFAENATFDGAIDDVHAYQRVLTGDEIRAMVGVPGTTTHNNIPSGQTLDKVFTLDNPASFKFVVKACRTGVTPPSCNESPAYRITSDAPMLPTDTETGMDDPTQPILSGMVNRPSGGPVTAKYYLYDNNGTPIGAAPLGTRTVNGGERASFQIPTNTVQPGTTYKWQMVACANGETAGDEICTSKTAPISFTTPGTPPPDPVENVKTLTLGKDSFVIKAAKTDPTACNGAPCTVEDATAMRVGGTGVDKTAAVIGFKLDELPDGAAISEGILKLGSATCAGAPCPTDNVITATPLKTPVNSESKGSDLPNDADTSGNFSLPIGDPKADIGDDAFRWLMLTSNKDEVITFGEAAAVEQPSLALTYLPAKPPSKVLNLAAQAGDASAIASWGLPLENGSMAMLDGYDVEVANSAGSVVKTLVVKDPYVAITGLTNGEAHTVKVRAKTAFGQSDWEATTVTPKAVPPPPVKDATNPCIPFLDGEQPPTRAAAEEPGAQEYIDRVKAYYQAQDAVLEGQAGTIWEASGVTPSAPNTAKLSLLNAVLVEQREAMQRAGESRTNSTVTLISPVVQAGANGTARVFTTVKRDWTLTTPDGASAAVVRPSGTVTPSDSTISIHVFDRCGNMAEIQVPLPAFLDPTDSIDSCAGFVDPDGSVQRVCGVSEEVPGGGNGGTGPLPLPSAGKSNKRCTLTTRQNYCEIIQSLGRKNWYFQSSVVSTWNPWDADAEEDPLKSWSAQRFENWLYVFPGNSADWNPKKTFTKNLLKALRKAYEIDDKKTKAMEMRAGACYEHNLDTTEVSAGLTVGASEAAADVGLSHGQTQGEECIDRAENNWAESQPSIVADKANNAAIWIRCTAKHLNSCSIDRFTHRMVGRLKVDFTVKSAKYLVVAEHAYRCAVERMPYGTKLKLRHAGCTVPDPTIIGGLN